MPGTPRPNTFEERYRLYVDESGDHVFREVAEPAHRFLCLLGCWFKNPAYVAFCQTLEGLKDRHFPHHPDTPVVLHREDVVNARRAFKLLREPDRRAAFDADLLQVVRQAEFRMTAVVIDKEELRKRFGNAAAHPYHLALGFMLQSYAGFLNYVNRVGDVMAEARGGAEDRRLKESYAYIYAHGLWGVTKPQTLQAALTSKELKLKSKSANIAGLQLADMLAHPVKQWVLRQKRLIYGDLAPFATALMTVVADKFNQSATKVEGYGYVLYPP